MAETPSATEPTLPSPPAGEESRDLVAVLPGRVRRGHTPRPGEDGAGQPVDDLPPLVEPMELVESPVQPAQIPASQRPVRRHFLAPLSEGAPPYRAEPQLVRAYRERDRDRGPARPSPAVLPPEPPAAARTAPPSAEAAASAAKPRRWGRRIGVGFGIVAAIGAAMLAEIGVNPDWFDRLRLIAAQKLVPLPPPNPAEVPSEPGQRLAYFNGRAKSGDAEAQLTLAIMYAKGDGVAQDYGAAANWFRAAALQGSMRAQYDLGVLYERGRGVAQDYSQAVSWYRRAAEQNHPLAQYNLAVAYTKGQGVRRDFFEAASWYHRAAAQGVVAAMVNLAILYERGEGLEASAVDAYAWYRAAAKRGSQPAARRADELLKAFSPWDQTRAEAKTADVAASIRDSIGERTRATARKTPAPAGEEGGEPVLKSGFENGSNPPRNGDTGANSP